MEKVEFELPIYTFQIDFVGHVNNAVYVQWMEIGRTKLLEAMGISIEGLTEQGMAPVLVHTEITYKQPLFLGDRVLVQVWVSELRHASAHIQFRFYKDGGVLAATGWQKGLFVDSETMWPHRLSKEMRVQFERFLN